MIILLEYIYQTLAPVCWHKDEKIKATKKMITICEGQLSRQMKEIKKGDDAGGTSSDSDSSDSD